MRASSLGPLPSGYKFEQDRSLACKIAGWVAGVRYIARPTIWEALFSYRRTA